VIERPASVVKELVENALDAGARSVRIDVRGGGLDLIRVGDDGRGIPSDQLPLAVQRHATSKLHDGDLTRVLTLGFRGEALPSIAAVAELTLLSAAEEDGVGRRLTLRDGRVVIDQPAPRPRGTTVTVRNLFQNVPARLHAAGRVQTEIAQIGQSARRLALAAPEVRLSLLAEDRLVFQTTGSSDVVTTLVEVYGEGLAGSLISLGPATVRIADGDERYEAQLAGVVAGSEVTRPGRGQVNVVVNGRWAQPRGLLALLEAAYRPLLPRGRHPILALSLDISPERVDINVHPAKLEVRLLDERALGQAAGDLLREALGRRPIGLGFAPDLGLDALASLQSAGVAEPGAPYEAEDDAPIVTPGLPPLRLLGQVQDRLILLEGPEGLYLVDQHRAHERILFERLAAYHAGAATQEAPVALPEPLVLELRPAQLARFGRRLEDLASLGFELERFGGRTFLLRSVPSLPGVLPSPDDVAGYVAPLAGLGEPDGLLASLAALADEAVDDVVGAGEGWRDRLLVNLSCRSAVRRGRSLDRPALRALVEGLGHSAAPAVCPHGSPLLMHVSGALLEKQFGWS
jgi:DNA mismatch repair protein MutL